jgi:hypothetical protein
MSQISFRLFLSSSKLIFKLSMSTEIQHWTNLLLHQKGQISTILIYPFVCTNHHDKKKRISAFELYPGCISFCA